MITQALKVLCFDTDSQVFILEELAERFVDKMVMGKKILDGAMEKAERRATITWKDSIRIIYRQVISFW